VNRIAPLYRSISKMGHRTAFVAFVEGSVVAGSFIIAMLLSNDAFMPGKPFLACLGILLVVRLLLLAHYNLMRGWWRYTGVNEVVDVIKAVVFGSLAFILLSKTLLFSQSLSLRVIIVESMGTTLFLLAGRMVSRLLADTVHEQSEPNVLVAVIGAGRGAEMLIREMNRSGSGYSAIACLDDDVTKHGISICGAKVEGSPDALGKLLKRYAIEEVWIAVPSASNAQMSRFVSICDAARVPYKTLPSLRDMNQDRDVLHQIREVNLDDLLGRDPVRVNLEIVREQIEGRTVMVTGAAGSIGSELCAQLLEYGPATLVCVDQNENGMFYLQRSHQSRGDSGHVVYCVADVCDRHRMAALFSEHEPKLVFHAASYKHVPMMEANVQEAVQNNVFSLLELLSLAESVSCESFVMISSDKAVNPSSVMGTTKRICELILASRPASNMRCVSVRFGNVLGSNGSVVPILQEQIGKNDEITITHPEIRRYFMTIHEAVSLVLQAFTVGDHGDLLVLDMGESIRILDLAHRLIRLNGKSVESANIKIVGLRDGEKLAEEMFYRHEERLPTVCEKIIKTRGTLQDWDSLEPLLQDLRDAVDQEYPDFVEAGWAIRSKMKEIVPEYQFLASSARTVTITNGHQAGVANAKTHRAAMGGSRANVRK
jgi:FlaA1/EpsC-like NDP-sugar epimerase